MAHFFLKMLFCSVVRWNVRKCLVCWRRVNLASQANQAKTPGWVGLLPVFIPAAFTGTFIFVFSVCYELCVILIFFFLSNLFVQLLPGLKVKQNCTSSSSHQNWNWQKGSAEPCQLYAVTETNKERLDLLENKMSVLQFSTTNTEQIYTSCEWMRSLHVCFVCFVSVCRGSRELRDKKWVAEFKRLKWEGGAQCGEGLDVDMPYDMQTPGTSDTEARLGVASPAICCLGH